MIIYDKTSLTFIKRCEEILKEVLIEFGVEAKTSRFLYKNRFYPLNVVVFEGGQDLGHFNSQYYQIAINRKLIYLSKDSVLRDILKHELAHYFTFIEYGAVQPHGPEFKEICKRFGFPDEIAHASLNLEKANLSKEGDLASEKVLEKVKKLLQLAQSSNSHEAEIATLKANALLIRHHLDHLSLNDDEPIYLDRVLQQSRKDAKMTAIYDMLKYFIVKPVISYGKGTCCLEVSGSLTNVKLAVYIATFLDKEFDYLWERAKLDHGLQGLRAKNSFYLGIAKGFEEKMKDSKTHLSSADQKSLVIVEQDLAAKAKIIYRRLSFTSTGNNVDPQAGAFGFQKGKSLSIRQGVENTLTKLFLT